MRGRGDAPRKQSSSKNERPFLPPPSLLRFEERAGWDSPVWDNAEALPEES